MAYKQRRLASKGKAKAFGPQRTAIALSYKSDRCLNMRSSRNNLNVLLQYQPYLLTASVST